MINPLFAVSRFWSRFADAYSTVAFRRPKLLISIFIVTAAIAAVIAHRDLHVVTDLKALLPERSPSVDALSESRRRIGSTDFFVIAVRSASHDIHAIARMQDTLKQRIETEWQDVNWVQIDRDTRFFLEHALYYLPEKKLEELETILTDHLHKEAAKSLPGAIDLLDDTDAETVETELKQWLTPAMLRSLGMPPQIEAAFLELFDTDTADRDSDLTGPKPAAFGNRLIGPKADVGVVLVQLQKPSTDLDYARFALNRGGRLIDDIDPTSIAPDLEAQVVGAYRSFKEVDAVSDDGVLATTVSVVSVLVLLFLFFRSFRRIAVVFVPLVLAGAFTMGITAVTYGRLTVLTIFVLAMLAGMGIDYSIHFMGYVLENTGKGVAPKTACRNAIFHTGAALFAAAATTIASLLVLLLGHFSGFREFGVVAAVGLVFSVVSALLVLPVLIALFPAITRVSGTQIPFVHPTLTRLLLRYKKSAAIGGAVFAAIVTLIAGYHLPSLSFEHDFRNLRGPKTGATIGYGRAIGKNASTSPSIVLGHSIEEMSEVHRYLLKRLDDPFLHSFLTLRTFVPEASEQRKRASVIARLHTLVHKKAFSRIGGKDKTLITQLRTMSAAAPFSTSDLPQWARRLLTEQDGSFGKIGHLYANVKDWDVTSVAGYKARYQEIPVGETTVKVASSAFILADIVQMVKADGLLLLIAVSIALFAVLLIYTRSLPGSLVILSTVGAGAVWTAGAMALLGFKVGLYNMITIPVILGVGIDGAIHISHRYRTEKHLTETVVSAGMLVTAGSWTTVCGFAGLLFVAHKGLQSIGIMATLGVALSYLATLALLPFLLSCFRRG